MDLKMWYVGSACFVLSVDEKIKVACDPALSPNGTSCAFQTCVGKRIREPRYEKNIFDNVQIWLLTHGHADHLDDEGIAVISKNAMIFAQEKVYARLGTQNYPNLFKALWGDVYTFEREGYHIRIKTVPAFHGSNLIARTLVDKVNGYLVEVRKGTEMHRIYITSDTIFEKSIVKYVAREKIDTMIANVGNVLKHQFGGPFSMSAQMLKEMFIAVKPGRVIPVHMDDFSHFECQIPELEKTGFEATIQGTWFTV